MNSAASEFGSRRGAGSGTEVAGQIYQRLEQNLATLAARPRSRLDLRVSGRGRQTARQSASA